MRAFGDETDCEYEPRQKDCSVSGSEGLTRMIAENGGWHNFAIAGENIGDDDFSNHSS